jgi:glycosyltransferase involved in cell wall biosynthesis
MYSKQVITGIRVAYLHGRPGPHPMHERFARAVQSEFQYIDFRMRWQDKDRSVLYRMASWFICAFTFPHKNKYNIFLVDNLHFMPVIMKMMRLIRKDQKIVAYMGSHTLYFIHANRFSKLNKWLHIQALKRYDAVICEGKMAEELVKNILGPKTPKLYTVYNGIPEEHFPSNSLPNLQTKNMLFIGHIDSENRSWYKGLDLMMDAFQIALKKNPEITFTIVGDLDKNVLDNILSKYDTKTKKAFHFTGESNRLDEHLKNASLYIHCARGEAFGITILIAMASGVPPIISEWTGAKEVVQQVSKDLIIPLDANILSEKIIWYLNLPVLEKQKLSIKCIEIAGKYTEKNAIDNFKIIFQKLISDFTLE